MTYLESLPVDSYLAALALEQPNTKAPPNRHCEVPHAELPCLQITLNILHWTSVGFIRPPNLTIHTRELEYRLGQHLYQSALSNSNG